MNSQQISDAVFAYARSRADFTAPYGVLQGDHTNRKGIKYKAVTFGRARTLDATVEIYNRNFIILRTSNNGNQVFTDYISLQKALEQL